MNFSRQATSRRPVSIIEKVFQTFFLSIFFLVGLFFFGLISREVWRTVQTYRWPATPCIIESCSVTNSGNSYRLAVAYRYEFNGQSIRSTKVSRQASGNSDYGAAQRQANVYPVGKATACYVNPSNPAESVLRHEKPWMGLFLLIPLVFMAVGAGGIYSARRSKPVTPSQPVAVSSQMGRWGLAAFFGVFLLVGAGAFYAIGVRPMLKIQEARHWATVPCTVVSSNVRSHSGSKGGTTYSVDILYRYEVDGREYRSNQYEFMGGSSSGYDGKAAIVHQFPPGMKATCYVNPSDPTEAVLEREFTTEMLWGLFPLIFFFVGAGGVTWALTTTRKPVINTATDAPWLQRSDWAAKRIVHSTKPTVHFAWSFAVIWNLVSVPVLLMLTPEMMKPGKHLLAIGLILPVVGVLPIVWAFRTQKRWQTFGDSVLELDTLPGAIGGTLEGKLHLSRYLQTENGFKLKLACINRVTTSSGKESSTSERTLWQDEQAADIGAGDTVPVAFYIPPDCRETDAANPRDIVLWRLEVTAWADELPYKSQFEIPVFKVALTPEQLAVAQQVQAKEQVAIAHYQQPSNSRILVQTAARGGKEFYFPAARNPVAALMLTVFLAIWSVGIWFMLTFKAPILFPIVFGLVELFLLYGFFQSWFGTTRVVVESGGITVAKHVLGLGRTRTIAFNDVEKIITQIGMTNGTTTYQDIKIVCRDGKEITAGSSIKDVREAEWLTAEMAKAAGLSGK